MSEAFLKVVNMSISAGWLVLAVLALRLILKKAPKWVNVLLWGIVAVRLICPFSIESALSLIPSTETISPEIMMDWTPEISTGIEPLDQLVNPVISTSFAPQDMASANPLQILIPVAANLWLLGVLILLAYTAISYLTLRHKLRTAVILRDNIFQCETISSPFVLGILKPKIYLPYSMDGNNLDHVVAHEKAHIKRKDHWWKPLGFLLLTVYWFNPLMWVAYILLCRDIELACDEKVIAELGNEQRADYTHALVACAVNRRMIAACPLAFGEVGVKDRVKSIMNYRKPTFWIVVTALVVCVAVAVCFLTDPAGTSLTKWTIDEVDMSDTLGDIDTMSVQYYGDSITCNNNDINRFVATMSKIKVGRNSLSQSRDENRDYAFTITINDGLHLHFTIDFSEIWVDNGVKPSFSYPITNPETAMELMLDFSFAHKGTVERWFDYSDNPSEMQWDGRMEANIPEFPDVTFRWYPEKMDAVTEEGITTLYTGMPIWSAYFCDLTGDGIPEICSQVSFGSGIIDSRVIIHDYANGVSYKLEDRGYHDYYLRMNDADGYLYVDKLIYNSDELVSSGRLVFTDGCIQIEGVDSAPTNILQAKLLEIHDGYFLLEPVEGSWELSSASQIEVPMKNMASSPEPQVGDILEIKYDGQLQETYPARITAVYGIRVISERPYVTEALTLNEVAELVKQQHTVSFVGMTREAVHGYGNLPNAPAYTNNTSDTVWTLGCELPSVEGEIAVYKTQTRSIEECDAFGEEFRKLVGAEYTTISYYQEAAYYMDQSGDENGSHFLFVSYLDPSYEYHCGFGDDPVWVDGERESIEKALAHLPVYIPEYAEFDVEGNGWHTFTVEQRIDGAVMVDGTLRCRYAEDGTIREVQNNLLSYTYHENVAVISPEEAFERLCDGKFNDGGFFEVERPHDVTVLSCELKYRIDTKGFYQPVYLYELSSEDGSYMDWIMIPAMK